MTDNSKESDNKKSPEEIVEEYESELKIKDHYDRAKKLGVSDYPETEDRARSILGDSLTREIIQQFTDSQRILFYLGKQPRKALPLPKLWATNPIECANEIKKISDFLKPPIQISKAPPPVPRIQGGGPALPALRDKNLNKKEGSPDLANAQSLKNDKPDKVDAKANTESAEGDKSKGSKAVYLTDGQGLPWIIKARELAESLIRDYPYKNQMDLADAVYSIMVKRKITGRSDNIPSIGSIKRQALTGIVCKD